MEKNKEDVIEFLKNLDSEDLVNLSNEFSQNNSFFDNEIYINDSEFFELFFTNDSYNLAQRICYGNYHTNEKFVKFNGYGNLESFDYVGNYIDFDMIAEAIIKDEFDVSNYL
jgi:hypothetical protein